MDKSVTEHIWLWHLDLYRVNVLPAEEQDPPQVQKQLDSLAATEQVGVQCKYTPRHGTTSKSLGLSSVINCWISTGSRSCEDISAQALAWGSVVYIHTMLLLS